MAEQPPVTIGQIFKENDHRFERYVEVMAVGTEKVAIRRVHLVEGVYRPVPTWYITHVRRKAFHSTRSREFRLIKDMS